MRFPTMWYFDICVDSDEPPQPLFKQVETPNGVQSLA